MLRLDLEAAGVPYCVEGVNGKEYCDFHSLRHTFVSALAATGIDAKSLQTLARHSDPRLTLGTYSHARSAELVKAVGRLKVPGCGRKASARLTLPRATRGRRSGIWWFFWALCFPRPQVTLQGKARLHLVWGFLGTPGNFWRLWPGRRRQSRNERNPAFAGFRAEREGFEATREGLG